jgi:uncharacterized protein
MADALPGSPVPHETRIEGLPPESAYDHLLASGLLGFQACARCSGPFFPPRLLCPACGASAAQWRLSRGAATVYSATTITPRGEDPYCVALVDVAEGYRMMTNIVGVPPEQVQIGDPVTVRIETTGDTILPLFEAVTR